MQLLKPVWISSEGQALMSIDIHPDASRFATGGQGDGGGGRVSIWNLKPVLDEQAERDKEVPKLLAQMDHHLGCVNCIRWSGNGLYLASGGDDKLVMIWKKSAYGGGGTIFGSGGKKQVESWKLHQTLRGHDGDVLDLAWGPGDALLATASVDNSVVVWNAEKFPEIVRRLSGHTGLVKGVIFDPVGKYLASQSDDRTLRLWRTEDWTNECVIKEPFAECGATTHVLRPGWSPEGSMLVSAHAMNGGGPTAQVVERGGSWKTQRDFVGHKKAVSCVRFCSSMLERPYKSKVENYVMVALGSRDRSFSVWTSLLQRPLFVVDDAFDQSVLDIAWSKDGRVLLACSMDGSVAACILSKTEVGRPFSEAELHALMVSKHGKNVGKATLTKSVKVNDKSAFVIENPEMLKATNGHSIKTQNGVTVAARKKLYPKGPTDKQIEARTSDGKRRITPIFIPPPDNNVENDETFGSTEFGSSSRKGKSDITVEVRSQVVQPNISPGKHSNDSNNSLMSQRVGEVKEKEVNLIQVKKAPGPPPKTEEAEVIPTKKKRKRILSSSSEDEDEPMVTEPSPPPPLPTTSKSEPIIDEKLKKRKRIKPEMINGSSSPSRLSAQPQPVKPPTPEPILPQPVITTASTTALMTQPLITPLQPYVSKVYTFNFEVKDEKGCKLRPRKVVVKVSNNSIPLQTSDPKNCHLHQIQFQLNGDQSLAWKTVFPSPVATVEGGENLVVVVCCDGSLHLYKSYSKGEKALPPLQLPSPASKVHLNQSYLSLITSCGHLYVWDLKGPKAVVIKENVEALIRGTANIIRLESVSRPEFCEFRPMIVTSGGKAFAYHKSMGVWMRIADTGSIVHTASKYSTKMTSADSPELPLAAVTYVPTSKSNCSRLSQEVTHMASLAHCQDQKAAALALGSVSEYKYWMVTYLRELCEDGEANSDLIRSELLSLTQEGQSDNDALKACDKKELLDSALNVIKGCLSLQRVFAEFEELQKSEGEVTDIDKMLLD